MYARAELDPELPPRNVLTSLEQSESVSTIGHPRSSVSGITGRRFSDVLLFGVTLAELIALCLMTPSFTVTDWIYVSQHLVVLAIALTRAPPEAQDRSLAATLAIVVAYTYPYAQIIYLRWTPGQPAWPAGGLVLVALAACLSFYSLLTMGRTFGIRPALRSLVTRGPYRFVRHPMYLAYGLADIGYNFQEWNLGTALMVIVGWISLRYRIHAEERIVAQDARWPAYVTLVRYRLLPGVW